MKQVWQIDPEFRRLSVLLSPEEENRLESSLLREGCKEPIAVWHGCILDGHKRYEICSYEEMDYKTVEMNFVSREDAIIWILVQIRICPSHGLPKRGALLRFSEWKTCPEHQ